MAKTAEILEIPATITERGQTTVPAAIRKMLALGNRAAEVALPVFLRWDLLMVFTPRLDILPSAQRSLWPDLVQGTGHFVLYGGTAIALRLGRGDGRLVR